MHLVSNLSFEVWQIVIWIVLHHNLQSAPRNMNCDSLLSIDLLLPAYKKQKNKTALNWRTRNLHKLGSSSYVAQEPLLNSQTAWRKPYTVTVLCIKSLKSARYRKHEWSYWTLFNTFGNLISESNIKNIRNKCVIKCINGSADVLYSLGKQEVSAKHRMSKCYCFI